ncbi:hypothetical protein F6X40_10385 [Paraburkholderia sp. UCT31]|uniref:hypothetical protein n=1 Tax=Paraburkholderia sp. UCT31 TaxID=2615209 RepID=UPI001655AD6A|nr:hypothetical protein [Paraburkholderia sp. UCT31]MBC8737215.1 hypothetical protein [Paraburkholderia sp. UCT31]
MSKHVLVFMGSRCHGWKHFENLHAILDYVPDAAQLVEMVQAFIGATGDETDVDWVDVLVKEQGAVPQQLYWELDHADSADELRANGFSNIFQLGGSASNPAHDGIYYGICEMTRVGPSRYAAGRYEYAPK